MSTNPLPTATKIKKPSRFSMFLAAIFRPMFGYKYKIVYTELEVKGSFQKRFIGKLALDDGNDKILRNLPKVNGCNYTTPVIIYYSKSEKNVNQRIQMKPKDFARLVYEAHFK